MTESLGVKEQSMAPHISYNINEHSFNHTTINYTTKEHSFNHTTTNYIINEHNFNRTTNWCIIDDNTTKMPMSNIAHASQIIISCWNWFQTQHEKVQKDNCSSCLEASMDSTFMDCGFYFGNLTAWKMVTPLRNREGWMSLFIQHMNCVLSDLKPSRPDVNWHRPNLKLRFDNVKSAVQMRTRILSSISKFYNDSFKFKEANAIARRKSNSLQIGLIDRKGSRAIKNKASIQKAMQSIFPTGHYEMTFMEDLSPLEQWRFSCRPWSSRSQRNFSSSEFKSHRNVSTSLLYPIFHWTLSLNRHSPFSIFQ